jgi:hypothetical protein
MRGLLSWSFIALACLPAASRAVSLDPISQDRAVEIDIRVRTDVCAPPEEPGEICDPPLSRTFDDFADAESAPTFGVFSATAADPSFPFTNAIQDSSISATTLAATGSWLSFANASFYHYTVPPPDLIHTVHITENHTVESRYEVAFELKRIVAFSLTGEIQLTASPFGGNDNAAIALVGPGANMVASIDIDMHRDCDFNINVFCSPQVSISQSGQLGPGVYTLRAYGRAAAASFLSGAMLGNPVTDGDQGSFEVQLIIEAPPVPALPPGGAVLLGGGMLASLGAARRASWPFRRTATRRSSMR